MAIEHVQCVTVTCDECGDPAGEDHTKHYSCIAEAREDLAVAPDDPVRVVWLIPDAGRVICPDCRLAALAKRHEVEGHDWGYFPGWRFPPGRTHAGYIAVAWRECACGAEESFTQAEYDRLAPPDAPREPVLAGSGMPKLWRPRVEEGRS